MAENSMTNIDRNMVRGSFIKDRISWQIQDRKAGLYEAICMQNIYCRIIYHIIDGDIKSKICEIKGNNYA